MIKVQNISPTVVDIPSGSLSPGETCEAEASDVQTFLDAGQLAEVTENKTSEKGSK